MSQDATVAAARRPKERIQTPWTLAVKRLRRNKLALVGLFVLAFMFLFCFLGPLFSPYDLITTDLKSVKNAPSAQHWLGTDAIGRDVLTRLMYGGRISLTVGLVVVAVSITIACMVGGAAGYYGGAVDGFLMRFVDVLFCIPTIPVLLLLTAVLSDMKVPPENRIYFLMLVLGALGWPGTARMVRGQILALREQEFMLAAEALGLRDFRKIFRHLIPNVVPQLIVSATLGIGGAILTESALSYLGMGVAMPYPSWGNMIQAVNSFPDLQKRPWMWIPAGLCIFITVMSINLLGDGLRDALDPKMKR